MRVRRLLGLALASLALAGTGVTVSHAASAAAPQVSWGDCKYGGGAPVKHSSGYWYCQGGTYDGQRIYGSTGY
ncbi:hypothetical protein SUDANB120_06062 [Streptomyces sp. enrichment culture]|uniref:hypothetical protein n=1 Tax=Streptomyces TaxID=1883 RepID=UPI0016762498|nr:MULTISPECIES: hypothetical protein [Streptomyces]MBD3577563.1 hypothetical protein [Streptomyces sp. KD18]GGT09922.1 hypothetical protein GCM10010286_39320 [Streptomyces toxytricini]